MYKAGLVGRATCVWNNCYDSLIKVEYQGRKRMVECWSWKRLIMIEIKGELIKINHFHIFMLISCVIIIATGGTRICMLFCCCLHTLLDQRNKDINVDLCANLRNKRNKDICCLHKPLDQGNKGINVVLWRSAIINYVTNGTKIYSAFISYLTSGTKV